MILTPIREIPLLESSKPLYWLILSDRVSIIRQYLVRPGKGGRLYKNTTLYIGCDSFEEYRRFSSRLLRSLPHFLVECREPKRVLEWNWELKARGDFSDDFLTWTCDNCDRVLQPNSDLSDMPSLISD